MCLDKTAFIHVDIQGLGLLSVNPIQEFLCNPANNSAVTCETSYEVMAWWTSLIFLRLMLIRVRPNSFPVTLLHAAVETWVWLAAPTALSACPRRLSARMTSLRFRKVWTEWRRGCPSSGIKLWLVLLWLWSFRKRDNRKQPNQVTVTFHFYLASFFWHWLL